jgi:uncharacterized coiled-coil DUF342 family protein
MLQVNCCNQDIEKKYYLTKEKVHVVRWFCTGCNKLILEDNTPYMVNPFYSDAQTSEPHIHDTIKSLAKKIDDDICKGYADNEILAINKHLEHFNKRLHTVENFISQNYVANCNTLNERIQKLESTPCVLEWISKTEMRLENLEEGSETDALSPEAYVKLLKQIEELETNINKVRRDGNLCAQEIQADFCKAVASLKLEFKDAYKEWQTQPSNYDTVLVTKFNDLRNQCMDIHKRLGDTISKSQELFERQALINESSDFAIASLSKRLQRIEGMNGYNKVNKSSMHKVEETISKWENYFNNNSLKLLNDAMTAHIEEFNKRITALENSESYNFNERVSDSFNALSSESGDHCRAIEKLEQDVKSLLTWKTIVHTKAILNPEALKAWII